MTSLLTLEVIKVRFDNAKCPEDVFGHYDLRTSYRRLAATCHPDQCDADAQDYGKDLYQRLGDFKRDADSKIVAGTWGDYKPVKPPKPAYAESSFILGKTTYNLTALLGDDAVANVHACRFATVGARGTSEEDKAQFLLKIAKRPNDNDLLEREYKNLKTIVAEDPNPDKEKFFAKQRAYVPFPVRTMQLAGTAGAKHRANLLVVPESPHFTAQELIEDNPKFRNGLPAEHVFWIFRRLLLTLWMAHLRGVVHGAVTPDHVLVYPKEHGLVLVDWTASCVLGQEKVPIISDAWEAFYPPEVRKKAVATPATDIYMAARLAIYLAGGIEHFKGAVQDALLTCLRSDPMHRPQDAEQFYVEFGALIERVHGPRKYVELQIN